MKKRYAVMCALALVGSLSGCGQTQAADNTISLTPVEETTADRSGRLIEYNFFGHRSEAEGVLFGCYIWDGSAWQKDEDATFGFRSRALGSGKGTIKFERDSDAANANYKIGADSPVLGGYTQVMDSPERNSLPTEGLTATVAAWEEPVNDVAVDTEIPLLVRVFRTDGTIIPVSIDAFSEPENSKAVQESVYAEVYTVIFCYEM